MNGAAASPPAAHEHAVPARPPDAPPSPPRQPVHASPQASARARACGFEPASCRFWYGWVVLCLATLARLLKSYGQNNTLFVSVPGILADDGMTRTELGSWFSAACIVAATVQPVFGRLHDRFGGRVCIPAALLALAVALLGLASSRRPAGVFLSLIGLRAVGLGALDTFSSQTVTAWFVRRRGTALAAMTIGFYVGTDVGTLQLVAGVARAAGWRAALAAAAATCVAAAPLCALLLRSTPESAGLLPDGKAPPAGASDAGAPAGAAAAAELGGVTRRDALRTPTFWVWGAFTFAYFFAASGTDFHLIPMARESGGVDVASTLSVATGVSAGLSCALVGVLMDRGASGSRILAASGALLSLYVLLLTCLSSAALAWLTGFVKGAADACAGISLPFLHAQRFGRRHSGAIFAANRTLGVVGSGLGPLLFGVARDRGGAFAPALRAVAVLPALCAAACVAVAPAEPRCAAGEPQPLAAAAAPDADTELVGLLAAGDAAERA